MRADDDGLLDRLPRGKALGMEEIAQRTGLDAGDLLARLVMLEASGRLQRLAGGAYVRP